MARARLALSLLAATQVLACGPSNDPELLLTQVATPIKDGYVDTNDKAVVGILHAGTGSLCTGTLIAPNAVLTARHCVSPTYDGDPGVVCGETTFGNIYPAPGFFVTTADELTLGSAGEFFGAVVVGLGGIGGIPAHVSDDRPFCGHDVAVIILDENVPAEKATPYLPRLEADPIPGESYSAVGYGGEDDAGNGSGTRRRRDDLTVTCLGTSCIDTQVIAEGQVTDVEWVGGGGVCRGDSGGPALDADDRVVGVTSRGTVGCELSLYGGLAPFAQWLKNTVVYASGMGVYEAPTWTEGATVDPSYSLPVGAPCSAPADCPSGLCVDGSCTRRCTEEGPCPDDWRCEEREGLALCVEPTSLPTTYTPPPRDTGCALSGRPETHVLALLGLLVALRRRRGR